MRTSTTLFLALAVALVMAAAFGLFGARAGDPDPAARAVPPPKGLGALRVVAHVPAPTTGRVAFQLHASEATYGGKGEPARRAFVEVVSGDTAGTATWVLDGLPYGDYAVKAYHDVNGNEKLDKGAFGIPSEPHGFSRNARGQFGPPAWSDVCVRFSAADRSLVIRLDR